MVRVIALVDMDCYYAQCEVVRNPSYRGLPLAVRQRNSIITCNYEARALGVSKMETLESAVKKCPQLQIVGGEDLSFYRQLSFEVFECLKAEFTEKVERCGLDEFYLDITEHLEDDEIVPTVEPVFLHASAKDIPESDRLIMAKANVFVLKLRNTISARFELNLSAGISTNKLLAKTVVTHNRPNGQTLFYPTVGAVELLFHNDFPLRKIHGIGGSLDRQLQDVGLRTIGDFKKFPEDDLKLPPEKVTWLSQVVKGVDDSSVTMTGLAKRLTSEEAVTDALTTIDQVLAKVDALSASVIYKLGLDEARVGTRTIANVVVGLRRHWNMGKHLFKRVSRSQDFGNQEVSTRLPRLRTISQSLMTELWNEFRKTHPQVMIQMVSVGVTFKDSEIPTGRLANYFTSSRLSFLGTWRSRLRHHLKNVMDLSLNPDPSDPEGEYLLIHLDFDCFFVQVAEKLRGSSEDHPVVVCSGMHEGSEICSANYIARQHGVRNGMCMRTAQSLCPSLKAIKVDREILDECGSIMQTVYGLVMETTWEVLPLSCDELCLKIRLDLTETKAYAEALSLQIFEATMCRVSMGIAKTCVLARLCTKLVKEQGGGIELLTDPHILDNLDFSMLTGIGGKTYDELLRITGRTSLTCSDVREIDVDVLKKGVGELSGNSIKAMAAGRDPEGMVFSLHEFVREIPKSISNEMNQHIRFKSEEDATKALKELVEHLYHRLLLEEVQFLHISLKLMIRQENAPESLKTGGHGLCDNWSRSLTLTKYDRTKEAIEFHVLTLFETKFPKNKITELRGIGVQLSHLRGWEYKDDQRKLCWKDNKPEGREGKPRVNTSFDVNNFTPYQPRSWEEIDRTVLCHLPEDIREEYMRMLPAKLSHVLPQSGLKRPASEMEKGQTTLNDFFAKKRP